ncbi:hypothetical protein [Secundilactobacillus paracollinoides]|nr:hypothetical protein [Secundilactobacillus paracollinoides]
MLVKTMWALVAVAALLAIFLSVYLAGLDLPVRQLLVSDMTHLIGR